jgi:Transcriptional regulatory protein, C terminal/Cysteine dioxygenase type I
VRTSTHLSPAKDYAARPNDWPFAPRWDPSTRWYRRLESRPDREVWLLTWLPGQETDLHDHGLERTVDVHVARVRSKLGDGWVKTIRGIGYRLADDVRVRIDRS